MRSSIAELVGTFVLVFVGTGSVIIDQVTDGGSGLAGIALAWGLVVAAMIYSLGDISGAHINPAVTIALCVARRFPIGKVVPYLLSQCVGALAASFLLRILFPDQTNLGMTLPDGTWWQSFLLEVVLTAILMFVILNVTVGGREKSITAGLVIGGVIGFEVLCGGPISGASMNPARSLGPAVVCGNVTSLWIYLSAPVIGGLLSVPIALYLRNGIDEEVASELDPE